MQRTPGFEPYQKQGICKEEIKYHIQAILHQGFDCSIKRQLFGNHDILHSRSLDATYMH